MRFRFKSRKLSLLYTEERNAHKYPPGVVDAFFEVMSIISAAGDERDLHAMKSLHFEKLKGKRKEQRSVRLNEQFRLTLSISQDEQGKLLVILDIEDYH